MRTAALALLLALIGVFASESALAHGRGRLSLGFHFGAPYYWGGPYWGPWWHSPPPYYYYPPAYVVPAQPTTYIEQGNESSGWWYYCDTARGYYPYVKECPSGWQRVPPAPPPAK